MKKVATSSWANPGSFNTIFRTSLKFAHALVDHGSIKFNSPQSWVKEGIVNGPGRGDIFEGVFAACDPLNIKEVLYYTSKYEDVYGKTINGLTFFRRKRTMCLPCYCFYILKNSLYNCPTKSGIQTINAQISGKYFQDFSDSKKVDAINPLAEDKPTLVIIHDAKSFLNRIKKKLILMGLSSKDIDLKEVEYRNIQTPFYTTAPSPAELQIKSEKFRHQSEGRIIINSDRRDILNYLEKNPIEIGSIKDIAHLHSDSENFINGISVETVADIVNVSK